MKSHRIKEELFPFFSSEGISHHSLARLHPTEILTELFSFINYYWD